MKLGLFLTLLVALLAGGFYFFWPRNEEVLEQIESIVTAEEVDALNLKTINDADFGFSFSYPSDSAYTLATPEVVATDPYKRLYRLTYVDTLNDIEDELSLEAAPKIEVYVYENEELYSALEWVNDYKDYAENERLFTPILETVVSGQSAVTYESDGLYVKTVYVVALSGYVYVFTGEHQSDELPHRETFSALVESVKFSGAAELDSLTLSFGVSGMSQSGLMLTPKELIEDSRCPSEVNCIQAGTVRIRTVLKSQETEEERTFVLGVPQSIFGKSVVLSKVHPLPKQAKSINQSEYRLVYDIK